MTPAYLLTLPDLHRIAEVRAWTEDEARRAEDLLGALEREAERGRKLAADVGDIGGLFSSESRP